MQTSVPKQYSTLGRVMKRMLHTKAGAFIGYNLGIRGFNCIEAHITRSDGSVELLSPTYNSRVDVGAALTASLISGTTLGGISSPSNPKYIALSTSSLTPAHGDTTLTGETAVSGLTRAAGTAATYSSPVSLDAAASYILSKTFTSGVVGPTVIQSAAVFDAVSTGNLFVEGNLSVSASLGNGDQITINWTINL